MHLSQTLKINLCSFVQVNNPEAEVRCLAETGPHPGLTRESEEGV